VLLLLNTYITERWLLSSYCDGYPGNNHYRAPGLFEISVATPPPRSLGIYALPPLTHNGEEIEVEGAGYVVTSVVVQFKLRQGKYVREHNK
jgi:hypothetical protein